ncbi:MAG: hypothetical protein QME94_04185 [Anaerolineae bacterium]|nr:hypothetical protein [Anaerolineae bacterium]
MEQAKRPDHWLQNAADLAMSALLARLDLERGGRPLFWVDFRGVPQASHSYWDYNDIAGRYVDGLVLARALTGRGDNLAAEALLREFLWAQQDPRNGLFYNPEAEGLADAEMDKYRPDALLEAPARHVDLFCQRAPLLAMATLLAAGDESVGPGLERMARGLAAIAERQDDGLRFVSYRWAPVIKPEWYEAKGPPASFLGYRYALLTGLARCAELSADPAVADLALGLARYYLRHGDVPPDGRFRGNTHSGGILPTLVGLARLGVWAGEPEMVERASLAYRWVRENTPDFGFLADGFLLDGFFSTTCETCALADLLHLAIALTEAGVADYWDDVERYARNQLLENQYRDAEALRRALPGLSDGVLSMLLGGFECAAGPTSLLTWNGAEGCCIGGGLRALYLVWRATLAETAEETRVNLGFSRSSPYVEVVGHEPWAGRIQVRVRGPRRVLIRAPEGVAAGQVSARVDGAPVAASWRGRYCAFEGLQAGQVAEIAYPLAESTRSYRIAGQDYQGRWLGSTMVEIQPGGGRYPTYQRAGLLARGDPAPDLQPGVEVPLHPAPEVNLW